MTQAHCCFIKQPNFTILHFNCAGHRSHNIGVSEYKKLRAPPIVFINQRRVPDTTYSPQTWEEKMMIKKKENAITFYLYESVR